MMNELVPDPPSTSRLTAHTNFATCRGTHAPVFSVNPGTTLDDVLVHLSMSLAAATESNLQACDMAAEPLQRVTWGDPEFAGDLRGVDGGPAQAQ